jgi:hypothetical protein
LGAIKPAKLVDPGSWSTFATGHSGASLACNRDDRLAVRAVNESKFVVSFVRLCTRWTWFANQLQQEAHLLV